MVLLTDDKVAAEATEAAPDADLASARSAPRQGLVADDVDREREREREGARALRMLCLVSSAEDRLREDRLVLP